MCPLLAIEVENYRSSGLMLTIHTKYIVLRNNQEFKKITYFDL